MAAVYPAQQALDLLSTLQNGVRDIWQRDISASDEARRKAVGNARKLITMLEPPENTILHHSFDGPPLNTSVRIATSMRLFNIIDERAPLPTTSAKLAEVTGANRSLIVKVMRLLTAAGYVAETEEETYIPTPVTKAMTNPVLEACIKHRYDIGLPALVKAPAFFESTGCQSTLKDGNTVFQDAFKTDLGFYDYLAQQPAIMDNFQIYMKSFQLRSPPWVDTFPVQERLIEHFHKTHHEDASHAVLLVDIAGGQGQDMRVFQQRFQHVPGRLILQDITADTASRKDSLEGIEAQQYDFFTPQTVQGKFDRVVYLPNTANLLCLQQGLEHTASTAFSPTAMTPGYSKLIIHELILPSKDCSWQHAAFDFIMMTSFSGSHRTESQWRSLLTSIGLQDITFWYPSDHGDGVIEAMRGGKENENGTQVREPTYHATEAHYSLPNDTPEHTRLADQAAGLNQLMHNTPIHAPLTSPTRILDIGCGTGTITTHLGRTYPHASIHGIDLSPVPSHHHPPNVSYIQGDIRSLIPTHPSLPAASFDLVFSRLLILGMSDWRSYVRDATSLLKPGGWVEMQDYSMDWYVHGRRVSDSWGWMTALRKMAEQKGWDLRCGRNLEGYMREAGLVDVRVREFRVPFGVWAAEGEEEGEREKGKGKGGKGREETRRIGAHAEREYPMLYWHAIPKMLAEMGYTEEEIERFRAEAKRDLSGEVGKEICFYVTVGRKV